MNIRRVARSPSLQSRSYAADDEFPHPQGGVDERALALVLDVYSEPAICHRRQVKQAEDVA